MNDHERFESAYHDHDWQSVLALAPDTPRGVAALKVGHAHWHLGAVTDALKWLELGLADAELPARELTPFLYAAGMARLLACDLPGARRHLLRALECHHDDVWRFPSLRGLAQVEMELGLLDAAAHRLRHLPDFGPELMHHVLRAKVAWRAGNVEAARANLWVALRHAIAVRPDPRGTDPYPLVDNASLLVSGAEILSAMGHGIECHRALDTADALLEASGVTGLPVQTHLRLCRAMAHRLTGEPHDARRILDQVEREMADEAQDLSAAVARERARLRWDGGDIGGAKEDLTEVAGRFEVIGYAWEAAATHKEASTGPPIAVDTEPLEQWVDEDAGFDEPPSVGVVVSLMLPDEDEALADLIGDLTEDLSARLARATEGYVDGWGTDGEELEIFVYGDAPDVLWKAMEPSVQALGLDGTVRLEWGDRFQLLLLDPPPDLAGLRRLRPLLPVLSGEDLRNPPLTLEVVASQAAIRSTSPGPHPLELEWVRSARLERGKIWLWRWKGDGGDYYVTLQSAPQTPPFVRLDAAEGLSPEQHLVSVGYGYRSTLPEHLW